MYGTAEAGAGGVVAGDQHVALGVHGDLAAKVPVATRRVTGDGYSKSRRRMISEVSASADTTMALPSRSNSFWKRSKSDSFSGVISSSRDGNDTAITIRSWARASSDRFCKNE